MPNGIQIGVDPRTTAAGRAYINNAQGAYYANGNTVTNTRDSTPYILNDDGYVVNAVSEPETTNAEPISDSNGSNGIDFNAII